MKKTTQLPRPRTHYAAGKALLVAPEGAFQNVLCVTDQVAQGGEK